jgi:hypothetical protein
MISLLLAKREKQLAVSVRPVIRCSSPIIVFAGSIRTDLNEYANGVVPLPASREFES